MPEHQGENGLPTEREYLEGLRYEDRHPTEPEMMLERRHRWEWPPVPEGWRACGNQTFDDDGRLWRTVTAAPGSTSGGSDA